MTCILCKEREARSRFNVLCLVCMAQIWQEFQQRIASGRPIGGRTDA